MTNDDERRDADEAPLAQATVEAHAEAPLDTEDDELEINPSHGELRAFLMIALFFLVLVALWTSSRSGGDLAGAGPGVDLEIPVPSFGAEASEAPFCPEDPLAPSLSLVAAQAQRDRGLVSRHGASLESPEALSVLEDWHDYNRAEAAAPSGKETQRRNRTLATKLAAFLETAGWDAYQALGLTALTAFDAALRDLEEKAAAEDLSVTDWCNHHVTAPETLAFYAVAGDLLRHGGAGNEKGLFTPIRMAPVREARRRFMLRVLFKARWFLWVQDRRPSDSGLSRFEYAQFLVWKTKRRGERRTDKLFGLVEELRSLSPERAWAHGVGCLLLQAGMPGEARRFFLSELALRPAHKGAARAMALIDGQNK